MRAETITATERLEGHVSDVDGVLGPEGHMTFQLDL